MQRWNFGGGGCRSVLSSALHSKPWPVFLPPKYVFSSYWICHYHNELPAFIPNNLLYYKLCKWYKVSYAQAWKTIFPADEVAACPKIMALIYMQRSYQNPPQDSVPALWWLWSGPREVVPWPQSRAESEGGHCVGWFPPVVTGWGPGAGGPPSRVRCTGMPCTRGVCLVMVFSFFCFYLHLLNLHAWNSKPQKKLSSIGAKLDKHEWNTTGSLETDTRFMTLWHTAERIDFSINGGSSTGYTDFTKSILTSIGQVLVGYMKLKGRKSTENI